MAGRPDDEALQPVAQHEHQRHQRHDHQIGVEAEPGPGDPDREHRAGQQRAMGEVDDVEHAVDQRQAEGDQRVDRAGHQPVQRRFQDDLR
ncbi:hypothetical protein D3C80_1721290 [compost metagenome]